MLNKWQITLLFLGDLLPLFLIGFLFSVQPFRLKESLLFSILCAVSVIGTYYWKSAIKESRRYNPDIRKQSKVIQKVEDRGSIYTIYMVTYISVIPLLSGRIVGLIAFGVIILIVYSLYINSDMLFYNPILALFGYRFYKVVIKDKKDDEEENEKDSDEIYIISKLKVKKQKSSESNKYTFWTLTDYTYYLDSPA